MRRLRMRCRKRLMAILTALTVIILLIFVAPITAQTPSLTPSSPATVSPSASTPTQPLFHDAMRKLWEEHIFWTHLVVVSLIGGQPDTSTDINRLLKNQADIGNAFKPFYGTSTGDQLTALLQTHIKTAGEVLTALKGGDTAAYNIANSQWYANANDIAAFWNKLNPKYWPLDQAQNLMKVHLDQILADANARLKQDWAGGVTAFDAMNDHILMLADFLSNGIFAQLPAKFAGQVNPGLYPTPTPAPMASPSGAPAISIVQPATGVYLVGSSDISVVVQVSNISLVDKIGQANTPGEGHLVYYLNVKPPTATGQSALTAPGTYAVSASTSFTWTGLVEGVYTFSVQLVNNDNTPLDPPVTVASTNTVYPG